LARISDGFDKTVGSFFYDTQKPLAIELSRIYKKINTILKNAFARTATGKWLDYKVAEQGLTRREATFSSGTVIITGDVGAQIQQGDKVMADRLTFTVTRTQTLTNGQAEVSVVCDTPGLVGNVPVGAINTFPVTLSGLISVTNPAAMTGGYDEESDDSLRQRYFEKVSAPATSGNKHHYRLWAKEVPGVGDARVVPLWNGPGTVKVIIVNALKLAAEPGLVSTVAAHIEDNRPIGAEVTVISAAPVFINISIVINKRPGAVDVQNEVETAITAFLREIAFVNEYVSIAHVGGRILACAGVRDFRELTVNGGTMNIPVGQNQVAVLGSVNISETY